MRHVPRPILDLENRDGWTQVCLTVSSLAANLAILAWSGIRHGGDTPRYLESAADLLSGCPFRGESGRLFLGYNSLIAIFTGIGIGEPGVIAFQFGAAALATLAAYHMARQMGGWLAGVMAAGFFVINVDIARFHTFVLTDSPYISLVTVTTWLAHRAVGRGFGGHLATALVGLVTASTRPNGWLLLPIVAIYWIARAAIGARQQYAAAGLVLICAGSAVLMTVPRDTGEATPIDAGSGTERVDVEAVPAARIPDLAWALHPGGFVARVFEELVHVRPYFSATHNAMILAMIATVYPLAVFGLIRRRAHPLARLMAAVIAGHLMTVGFTFPDVDGRYLLYIFPLIVVFAACGATTLRES